MRLYLHYEGLITYLRSANSAFNSEMDPFRYDFEPHIVLQYVQGDVSRFALAQLPSK